MIDFDADEETLANAVDLVAFLGPVLDQLEREGEHQAVASLRDDCETLVRDILQEVAK